MRMNNLTFNSLNNMSESHKYNVNKKARYKRVSEDLYKAQKHVNIT